MNIEDCEQITLKFLKAKTSAVICSIWNTVRMFLKQMPEDLKTESYNGKSLAHTRIKRTKSAALFVFMINILVYGKFRFTTVSHIFSFLFLEFTNCVLCCSPSLKDSGNAFYRTPLKCPKADCWYSNVPVGHNKLAGTVKRLCEEGGISGYRTNHSLRATAATRMYDMGVDEQLICEKTG